MLRRKVQGGWLVVVQGNQGNGITFCPDPKHEWEIVHQSAERPANSECPLGRCIHAANAFRMVPARTRTRGTRYWLLTKRMRFDENQ